MTLDDSLHTRQDGLIVARPIGGLAGKEVGVVDFFAEGRGGGIARSEGGRGCRFNAIGGLRRTAGGGDGRKNQASGQSQQQLQ